MKLNLPSTWTQEKITSLIFLTWLSANRVSAGKAFRNCMISKSASIYYDLLINFPFASSSNITAGKTLGVCCASHECSPQSISSSSKCVSSGHQPFFVCNKADQTIICVYIGNVCLGIVGDAPITSNITAGNNDCSAAISIDTISNYIATLPFSTDTKKYFNFEGVDEGYAFWICSRTNTSICQNYYIYGCSWDNDGWVCYGFDTRSFCFAQWTAPWPGPADKNPSNFAYSVSTVATSVSTSSPTPIPIPENNLHLVEKIAIPIGTTVGVGSGSGLVYWLWRRKIKKKKTNNQQLLTAQEIELFTLNNQNELEQLHVELTQKKSSLTELTTELSNKLDPNSQASLKLLLKAHGEIIKNGDNSLAGVQLERAKEQLSSVLGEEEIQNLLDRQTAFWTKQAKLMHEEEQYQSQIVQLPPQNH